MPDNYEVYYLGTADSPMFLQQWLQGLLDDNLELVCFSEGWWVFRKVYPLEDELRAEIARLKNQVTDYLAVNAELVEKVESRDEIITRLKEDAERLAKTSLYDDKFGDVQCVHCGYVEQINDGHSPNCPITLHRELVAKYGTSDADISGVKND